MNNNQAGGQVRTEGGRLPLIIGIVYSFGVAEIPADISKDKLECLFIKIYLVTFLLMWAVFLLFYLAPVIVGMGFMAGITSVSPALVTGN